MNVPDRRGKPLVLPLEPKRRYNVVRGKVYTYNGREDTLRGHCDHLKLSVTNVRNYMYRYNCDIGEAIKRVQYANEKREQLR